MKRNIAINGFGRIGRATAKIILNNPDLNLVAINDLMPIEKAEYLLKFDSIYGNFDAKVISQMNILKVNGHEIKYMSEKDPLNLPWDALKIDLVIESTGLFTSKKDAEQHLKAGAKRVIISGPSKDSKTIIYGVNKPDETDRVFSCASCTTNNITPLLEILGRRIGVEKAILNTTHASTASQSIVDGAGRDLRMSRAAGANLIPTTTGAAIATTRALPQYEGLFDGIAVRVPVSIGSLSDITFVSSRKTSAEEINEILEEESGQAPYKDVIQVSHDDLVSTDIIKNPHAAIVDAKMTKVVDGNLVKLMAWYDNEWGFSNQMIRQIAELEK